MAYIGRKGLFEELRPGRFQIMLNTLSLLASSLVVLLSARNASERNAKETGFTWPPH